MCPQSQGKNKQGTGPVKWITGTVTEILECGCSYMVQAPNSRVYRRNRAHLMPICHDGSSFQDHLVRKKKKQLKNNSFQDHLVRKEKKQLGPNSGLALEVHVEVASLVYDADSCLCSSIQQPITLKVLGAGCWSSFTERRLQ